MLALTCSNAYKCHAYITYEAVLLWHQKIRPSFQTPKIFSLSVDREKHSPLSSIILSHPAKAAALGGSVKSFILDLSYICLLCGVTAVYYLKNTRCFLKCLECLVQSDVQMLLLRLLVLIEKLRFDPACK